MAVNPMLGAGMVGIQKGLRGVQQAAQDVAEQNLRVPAEEAQESPRRVDEVKEISEALVDMRVYERQVQASAKVVAVGDAVTGTLIDTIA